MNTRHAQRGFSLLEMIIVVAILLAVTAIVFETMNGVRGRAAVQKGSVEGLQDARNVLDLISRDLHNSGYPNYSQYNLTTLNGMTSMSVTEGTNTVTYYTMNGTQAPLAFGIILVTDTTLLLEGDVNNDGHVEQVAYRIQPDPAFSTPNGDCPCVLQRNIVYKETAAAAYTSAANPFSTVPIVTYAANWDNMVGGIVNSGSSNFPLYGSSTSANGITTTLDTAYAAYKSTPVFQAITDSTGKPLAVTVNLAVLGQTPDSRNGQYPVATLTNTTRVYQPQ